MQLKIMREQDNSQQLSLSSFFDTHLRHMNKQHVLLYILLAIFIVAGLCFWIYSANQKEIQLTELHPPQYQVPYPKLNHK